MSQLKVIVSQPLMDIDRDRWMTVHTAENYSENSKGCKDRSESYGYASSSERVIGA